LEEESNKQEHPVIQGIKEVSIWLHIGRAVKPEYKDLEFNPEE
jgi:hypothetical protein